MNSCQDLMEHDGMESRTFPDLLSPLAWFDLWNTLSYSCALCSWGGASALKRMGGKLCRFDCLSSGFFGALGVHFECYVLRRCLFDKVIEYIFCIICICVMRDRVNLCLYSGCNSLLFKEYLHIFNFFLCGYFTDLNRGFLMMTLSLNYAHPSSYKIWFCVYRLFRQHISSIQTDLWDRSSAFLLWICTLFLYQRTILRECA